MKPIAIAATPLALVLVLAAGFSAQDDDASVTAAVGVDPSAIPQLARQLLPTLQQTLTATCPELPALWVVAEAQAESSWDARAFSSAGAAGLLQMMPGTWREAGGPGADWSAAARPPLQHPVWDPATHLRVAIGWMCSNLRLVADHLRHTGKPTEALDALAVCHIAGCSRVTGSATGIPKPGEAGCSAGCVRQIRKYLVAIRRNTRAYALPIVQIAGGTGSSPEPFGGQDSGCHVPDPTGTGGCVTPATAWLLAQVAAHVHRGSVSCWDEHAWNPGSDHPQGKACDYTMGKAGQFPDQAHVREGWTLANWLRTYAQQLRVSYVIWQGRIWSRARNYAGWRPYSGGGVYDPRDATSGHYDHVHVSLTD